MTNPGYRSVLILELKSEFSVPTLRLSGLALTNIHYEKPVDYDAVVQLFAERYSEECFLSIPSLTKHIIEYDKMQCNFHSFFNANLHVFT